MSDRDAIETVARRYVQALDSCDVELLRSCYHPGAFEDHNGYQGDVDGFCEHLLASRATTESTSQEISGINVEIDGDRATSVTSCVAVIRTRPSEQHPRAKEMVVELQYVDALECREGEWRTVRRVCKPGAVRSVTGI